MHVPRRNGQSLLALRAGETVISSLLAIQRIRSRHSSSASYVSHVGGWSWVEFGGQLTVVKVNPVSWSKLAD